MQNQPSEDNSQLQVTPQQEIEELIKERVSKLAATGNPERSAALWVEYRRSQLDDNHPSKKPGSTGVLEGEKVSLLAKFEEEVRITQDTSAFITAFTMGGMDFVSMQRNALILLSFIRQEQPHLMNEATQYLLTKKAEEGVSGHISPEELERGLLEGNQSEVTEQTALELPQ
ncbi:MAG: hypothetical protein ACRYFX_13950 [Janthinobacterium lividum]